MRGANITTQAAGIIDQMDQLGVVKRQVANVNTKP
jgi:hypothetical protein